MRTKRELQTKTLLRLLRSYLRKDWIKSKRVIESVLNKVETKGFISASEFRSIRGLIEKEKCYLRLSEEELVSAFDTLFIPPQPPETNTLDKFFK
jgi:hypothetical protein